MLTTPFDTYFCGRLLKADARTASEVLRRFGGWPKVTMKGNVAIVVGHFTEGLTHEKRVQITSALTNEGIFAI